MTETVRGNRASTLRSRIPRPAKKRPDLWVYTSPCPASFAALPRVPVIDPQDLPDTSLEHLSLSQVPVWMIGGRQDPEASSEHRARSTSCTSVPETSSMRARSTGRKNWVHAIEAEHKKLEHIQAVFLNKLRSLADRGQKLPGVYKFVVLQEGDIPLLSSRAEKEKQLAAELATRDLTIAELRKQLLLSEELACEQTLRLKESNRAQIEKDEAVKYLKTELSSAKNLYSQLCSHFKEADHNLDRATKQVNQYLENTTNLETELKTLSEKHAENLATVREQEEKLKAATAEAELHSQAETQLRKDLDRMNDQLDLNHQVLAARSEMITKLQQSERSLREKFEDIFHQVGEKNTRINQLSNELDAKDEQFRNVMVTLKEKQGSVRRQENIIKLLEEQGVRTSLMRAKQEERTAAMQLEIAQLRHNLRNQAHVMVFGDMQTENAQTTWQQQQSQQERPSQEQHQLQ